MSETQVEVPSVRLTISPREEILNSVMFDFTKNFLDNHGVEFRKFATENELSQAIGDEHKAAMTRLWHLTYPGVDLSTVPKALRSVAAFSVKIGDRVESAHLDLPGKQNAIDGVFDEDDPRVSEIFSALDAMISLRSRLHKEQKAFKADVRSVLDSVTTTKRLLEVWPSVKNFLPAHIMNPEKGIQLPAKLISNLDEKLGVKP